MDKPKLLSPYKLGKIELKNHIVMAPMTRSRAIDNVPNSLMAEYYGQRATAGLIITEGTSPSPNGLGYNRIPGMFSNEQIKGWKLVTERVHEHGGRIFLQLMHTGRIGHQANLPKDALILAPSAVAAKGKIWSDTLGSVDYPQPKEMTAEDVVSTKLEFVSASVNAIEAGFDGVELHGANGYLLEQFLSPHSNIRTDEYGGSIENRCRFVLEVAKETAKAIGSDKLGIRLSPYGVASDMQPYPEIDETYDYLSIELNKLGLLYIHLVDHSSMGAPAVPFEIKQTIRNNFKNTLILAGGFNEETSEVFLDNGIADLVAFGKPFINNPDLVRRFEQDLPISQIIDVKTFYTADAKGYTDYPFAE